MFREGPRLPDDFQGVLDAQAGQEPVIQHVPQFSKRHSGPHSQSLQIHRRAFCAQIGQYSSRTSRRINLAPADNASNPLGAEIGLLAALHT